MKKRNVSAKPANILRKRAETVLIKSTRTTKAISQVDGDKLMYELQVHQIELEMQNEELRNTQLALEESRNRYVDLYDFAPVGYFILDKGGVIEEVNLAGAQLLGIERRYLVNRSFFHFISRDSQDTFYRHRQSVVKAGTQQTCEVKLVQRDGTLFYAQLISVAVQHSAKNYGQFRISITDISQRRAAEARIRQREVELAHFSRLHTMGEMVSGIAHELNQPLTAIVHYIGGCITRLYKTHSAPEIINVMERVMLQAEQAGAIIHRLKAFLKKETVPPTILDINTIIRSTLDLMEYEIKHAQIKIQLGLSDVLPAIKGDPIQLQQVILNIVHNAIEAMQTTPTKPPQLNIQTYQMTPDKVEIMIADNGQGISDNQINHIFDPFFSTKAAGMGMGLAIVRSILESHGGNISVMSNAVIGTRFHLTLPVYRGDEENTLCTNL